MSTDYSENTLVEQPAIALFSELGYDTANCFYETVGGGSTLGRETTEEAILVPKLRSALEKLNPELNNEAINLAIDELAHDRSAMSLVQANREVYKLLKDGVKVAFKNDEGEETDETVRIIDWNAPENNDFFLASQFWVSGSIYKRRADLVGFVNGLPLIFVELKKSHGKIEHAYKHNLKDYNRRSRMCSGTTARDDISGIGRVKMDVSIFDLLDNSEAVVQPKPTDVSGQAKPPATERPADTVQSMVVHCKRDRFDILIDRQTVWGNRFVIGRDGDRDEVIRKHRAWFVQQSDLIARLPELRGRVLGCHCHPKPCHCDFLAALANGLEPSAILELWMERAVIMQDGNPESDTGIPPVPYEVDIETGHRREQAIRRFWGTNSGMLCVPVAKLT